ncbi:MAG: GNAT family N-acetyltransferase [Polaromonas sp.]
MKNTNKISLGTYNQECFDKSWAWLNDAETKKLTMTPDFTRNDQFRFFEQLPHRTDYLIWSVILDDEEVIGAAGLKNHRAALAEYWGYIGEKQHWNKGLGRSLVRAVELKAKKKGFVDLDLKVSSANPRAIALYEKVGFLIDPQTSTESCLRMVKRGIR